MPVDDKPELEKSKMNVSASLARKDAPSSARPVPALAADIQAQIGRKLMAVYDDVLQQPVPDRFRLLLEQLDAKPDVPPKEGGLG